MSVKINYTSICDRCGRTAPGSDNRSPVGWADITFSENVKPRRWPDDEMGWMEYEMLLCPGCVTTVVQGEGFTIRSDALAELEGDNDDY